MIRILLGTLTTSGLGLAQPLNPTSLVEQHHRVQLSPAQEVLAGITSQALEPVHREAEFPCYGRVVDMANLLELKQRYQATEGRLAIQNAGLALAEKNLARARRLHQAEVIPARELIQTETQWRTDQARQQSTVLELETLREEILYRWGPEISRLILQPKTSFLEALLRHEKALVQVTLPRGQEANPSDSRFWVARHLDRVDAVAAQMIAQAPKTDEQIQGESWFLEVPGAHFRAGMRVQAWFTATKTLTGLEAPRSSVLWFAGRTWVYLREAPGVYVRIPVDFVPTDAGRVLLLTQDRTDRDVVTIGAQNLLAEEFHDHIPQDDPEAE